jgi:hypothetical protein
MNEWKKERKKESKKLFIHKNIEVSKLQNYEIYDKP